MYNVLLMQNIQCTEHALRNIFDLRPGESLGIRSIQQIIVQVLQDKSRRIVGFVQKSANMGSPVLEST